MTIEGVAIEVIIISEPTALPTNKSKGLCQLRHPSRVGMEIYIPGNFEGKCCHAA